MKTGTRTTETTIDIFLESYGCGNRSPSNICDYGAGKETRPVDPRRFST